MSEQDKTQSSGQEQTRDDSSRGERGERSGSERGDRGSSGGGRHGGRRRHQSSQQSPQQSSSRRTEATSLNMRELREVVELFTSHGLTEFEIENEDIRIRLGKRTGESAPASDEMTYTPGIATIPQKTAAPRSSSDSASTTTSTPSGATGGDAAATARGESGAEDLHMITAPIVGTFYRKPSPTSDEFVRVGSRVGADTVVCIIEAMKLMNEILAETTGTVEKIYVENGQPVEYGQPLFGIRR